jgi:hypothetical protein
LRAADGPISTKLISTADYRIQSAIDTRSANGLQLWQLYERSDPGRAALTAAALKPRSRQKAMQAVAPMAKSAMPTSNWNGLTSHPMRFAAVAGKKT